MAQHLQAGVAGRPRSLMAAVNVGRKASASLRWRAARQPGLLADVPMQSVAWPQLLPLGEVSLLGAERRHWQGIWQAQLIAYVTAGQDLRLFSLPAAADRQVLLLAGETTPARCSRGPSAGGRGRHEPGAGADRRRLLLEDQPAPYPRAIRHWRILPLPAGLLLLIVGPAAGFLPADVEMASRNQMRRAPAAAAHHCCQSRLRGAHRDAPNKSRAFPAAHVWPTARISGTVARSVLMMGRARTTAKFYLSHEKAATPAPSRRVLHIDDVEVEGVKTARAVFDGYTDKEGCRLH